MGINGAIKTKELLRSYCAPARGGRESKGGRGEHGGNESAFHVHAIKGDEGKGLDPCFQPWGELINSVIGGGKMIYIA